MIVALMAIASVAMFPVSLGVFILGAYLSKSDHELIWSQKCTECNEIEKNGKNSK